MMNKKLFTITLAAATLTLGTTAAAHPAEGTPDLENSYYPTTAMIIDLDYDTDTVTLEKATGFTYTFTGCEDYCVGDLVSLIMDNMGTLDTIEDDQIISHRYSGYYDTKILDQVVGFDATDSGVLLHFEDGTGYYIEK